MNSNIAYTSGPARSQTIRVRPGALTSANSELADKADLRLEVLAVPILDALLSVRDQLPDVAAVAEPRLTMMLACMCEICASPTR